MRKIRIGNDIRLKLSIEFNDTENAGYNKLDDLDQSNIKQVRCYLINTSFDFHEEDHCDEFKRVGFPEFYRPTKHNVNTSGFSSYLVKPANLCRFDIPENCFRYSGFGIYPEHHHCDRFRRVYGHKPPMCHPHCVEPGWHFPDMPCDHPHMSPEVLTNYPEYLQPVDVFGKGQVVLNHPHMYNPYYLADAQVLHETNTISCLFPAVQQLMCGTYKLVIVLTIFEQGWGRHNLRTYTVDKGDIFELVDDETGESGNVLISVDDTGNRENVFSSIYTYVRDYKMATDSTLAVGGKDLDGVDYKIHLTLKDGSNIMYTPYDWHFNELQFSSSDEEALTVGTDGKLYAHNFTEGSRDVVVTVNDIDNNVAYQYNVRVVKIDSIKMGFSTISSEFEMTYEDPCLELYGVEPNIYTVTNPIPEGSTAAASAKYLWVFSRRRIQSIESVVDGQDLVAELSSGIRVPTLDAVIMGGHFVYRSVAPILGGDMNIKIEFV